jgi:hypothetical protein
MGTNNAVYIETCVPKKGRKGWSLGERLFGFANSVRHSVSSGSPLFLRPARHPVVCIRGECFAVACARGLPLKYIKIDIPCYLPSSEISRAPLSLRLTEKSHLWAQLF